MNPQTQTQPKITPVSVPEGDLEPFVQVIIHNDDVTPMDFVVHVLERIFFLSQPDALGVMYTAHYSGRAYV